MTIIEHTKSFIELLVNYSHQNKLRNSKLEFKFILRHTSNRITRKLEA